MANHKKNDFKTAKKLIEQFTRLVLRENSQKHLAYIKTKQELADCCNDLVQIELSKENLFLSIVSEIEGRGVMLSRISASGMGNTSVISPDNIPHVDLNFTLATHIDRKNENLLKVHSIAFSDQTQYIMDNQGNRIDKVKSLRQIAASLIEQIKQIFSEKSVSVSLKVVNINNFDFNNESVSVSSAYGMITLTLNFNSWKDLVSLDQNFQISSDKNFKFRPESENSLGHNTQVLRDMFREESIMTPPTDSKFWIRLLIEKSDTQNKKMNILIENAWHEITSPQLWLEEVISEIKNKDAEEILTKFFKGIIEIQSQSFPEITQLVASAKNVIDNNLEYQDVGLYHDEINTLHDDIIEKYVENAPSQKERYENYAKLSYLSGITINYAIWSKWLLARHKVEIGQSQNTKMLTQRYIPKINGMYVPEELFSAVQSLLSDDEVIQLLRKVTPAPSQVKKMRHVA